MTRLRLALGLLGHAVRWHLQPRWLATRLGYQLRPYCWRLDRRHPAWQHRRCRCAPPVVITLTCDIAAFDAAMRRAADSARSVR